MEDNLIVKLYFERDENAITETKLKYNNFLFTVASNILNNNEDSLECVNDTYLSAWQSIPPKRPVYLKAFLSKITRNLSLNKLRFNKASKRNVEESIAFDELSEIIPDELSLDDKVEAKELSKFIEKFLLNINKETRIIFLRRFFFADSVSKIASEFNLSESAVKMRLLRVRNELYEFLRKENLL